MSTQSGEGYAVHQQGQGEEGGGEAREAGDNPQKTVAGPKPIWEMLSADDAGIASRSKKPCEDYDNFRHSVRLVRIDRLGKQDGNHVSDDERYEQGQLRY